MNDEKFDEYQEKLKSNNQLFLGFLVAIGYLFFLGSVFYSIILAFISNVTIETNNMAMAAAEVLGGVVSILLMIRIFKDKIGEFLHSFTSKTLKEGLKYFVIMLLVSVILTYIDLMIFKDSPSTNANEASIDQSLLYSPIFMIIYTCIIAPIMEEIIFRHLIFKTIAKKHPILGIIVGGSTFGLIHMVLTITNFIDTRDVALLINDLRTLPTYIAAGVVLCIAYYKTNNLSTSIMTHAFNNIYACAITLVVALNGPVIVKNIQTTENTIQCKIVENLDTNIDYVFEITDSKGNEVTAVYEINDGICEFKNLERNEVYYIDVKFSYNEINEQGNNERIEQVIEIYAKTR